MHLVLTGATGLVGSGVLDAMLRSKDITKISILSRRPVAMADNANDPRVNVIIHRDFGRYDASVLEQLRGASGCVWALGVSQTQVNAEQYVKITKDYALSAAKAFTEIPREGGDPPKPFRFVYVSGEGATQNPGRFSPIFARVKGETEAQLAEMTTKGDLVGKLQADTARPCAVDATGHEAITPYIPEPTWQIKLSQATLMGPIKLLYSQAHAPTPMLGNFLMRMAMGEMDAKMEGKGAFKLGASWVVANVGIRRMMGL
jgi:hypothetical protein